MNALDESGINKDFTEKSIDWIATAGKRSRSNISYSAPPPIPWCPATLAELETRLITDLSGSESSHHHSVLSTLEWFLSREGANTVSPSLC